MVTIAFAYDAAGNLTGASGGVDLGYNAKGQTTSADGTPMSYADATSDRRITAGDRRYAYTQLGLSSETLQPLGTETTHYVRDNQGTPLYQRDASLGGGNQYYVADALGSVGALTDDGGGVSARYEYDPYGRETTGPDAAAAPWRFAGGYADSFWPGVKLGTRYYHPGMQRWTQHDPERGSIANPMTLNPYLYVGCNPVNYTDPSGRQPYCAAYTAIGGVLSLVGIGLIFASSLLTGFLAGTILFVMALGFARVAYVEGCWGFPGPWEY